MSFYIFINSFGDLEGGWMWWLMTSYQQSMGDWSSFTLKTQMSSGLLCWRKPTPSIQRKIHRFSDINMFSYCTMFLFSWVSVNITFTCVRVCGSYTDMQAGTPAEALMDFTGGVHMYIQLSVPPLNLWELMCRAGLSKSLMGSGTSQGVGTNILINFHLFCKVHIRRFREMNEINNKVKFNF